MINNIENQIRNTFKNFLNKEVNVRTLRNSYLEVEHENGIKENFECLRYDFHDIFLNKKSGIYMYILHDDVEKADVNHMTLGRSQNLEVGKDIDIESVLFMTIYKKGEKTKTNEVGNGMIVKVENDKLLYGIIDKENKNTEFKSVNRYK